MEVLGATAGFIDNQIVKKKLKELNRLQTNSIK